jgi:hypothetical protein
MRERSPPSLTQARQFAPGASPHLVRYPRIAFNRLGCCGRWDGIRESFNAAIHQIDTAKAARQPIAPSGTTPRPTSSQSCRGKPAAAEEWAGTSGKPWTTTANAVTLAHVMGDERFNPTLGGRMPKGDFISSQLSEAEGLGSNSLYSRRGGNRIGVICRRLLLELSHGLPLGRHRFRLCNAWGHFWRWQFGTTCCPTNPADQQTDCQEHDSCQQ